MPITKRFKTNYPGVYYILGKATGSDKAENIYYVYYRKDKKQIEEKVGRQFQDNMTAAKAARIRALRIEGKQISNREKRERQRSEKEAKKWTLNALWEEYRSNKPHVKSIQTDNYRYHSHIELNFGSKTPSEMSPFDFDRLRVDMLKTHSNQSVKHVLALIKRIINFGVSRQICLPISFKIEMPSVDNKKTENLTPEQLKKLVNTLDNFPDVQIANIVRLALYTGMRRGEILELKWSDIDFEREFITIRNPKGGKSQAIPINAITRKVLEKQQRINNSLYVFPNKDGGKRYQVNCEMQAIKKQAELPKDFRPLHGLRHVFASTLASSGQVDMYTLQKLLTHKSPLMTQRYAHLRDDALKKASNLAGELIENAIATEKKTEQNVS